MEALLDLSSVSIFVCKTSIQLKDLESYTSYLGDVSPVISGENVVGYTSNNISTEASTVDFRIYMERACPERFDIESRDMFLVPVLAIKNNKKICAFRVESRPFGSSGDKIWIETE